MGCSVLTATLSIECEKTNAPYVVDAPRETHVTKVGLPMYVLSENEMRLWLARHSLEKSGCQHPSSSTLKEG